MYSQVQVLIDQTPALIHSHVARKHVDTVVLTAAAPYMQDIQQLLTQHVRSLPKWVQEASLGKADQAVPLLRLNGLAQ